MKGLYEAMIGGTCGWDRSRYQPVTPTGGNLTPQDLPMVDVSAGCQVGCSGREISLDRLPVSLTAPAKAPAQLGLAWPAESPSPRSLQAWRNGELSWNGG